MSNKNLVCQSTRTMMYACYTHIYIYTYVYIVYICMYNYILYNTYIIHYIYIYISGWINIINQPNLLGNVGIEFAQSNSHCSHSISRDRWEPQTSWHRSSARWCCRSALFEAPTRSNAPFLNGEKRWTHGTHGLGNQGWGTGITKKMKET